MNQILLTEENINNKSKKNINLSNSNDIKKIIIFFSIVILVFGIAIGAVFGYRLLKNNKEEDNKVSKLEIELKDSEDSENVIIIADSEVGIDKIIYSWNDEEKIIEELNGKTELEKLVEKPYGENDLKVKVIDINENEIEKSQTFFREEILGDGDETQNSSEKVEISTSIVEEENAKRIKISAKSESPMKYLTYKWNNEEPIKIKAEGEEKVIETTIDVLRGNNKLTIGAEDNEGNTNSIDKNFDGRLKPEIYVITRDDKLYMKISHDMGFNKIQFSINGTIYTYDKNFAGYDEDKKEIEYYFNLQEGENIVIIQAISTEDTEEIYKGKCNYTAQ